MKKALITIFAIIGVISTLLILVGVGYFLGMKKRTSAPVPTATATPEPTATAIPTNTPTITPTPEPNLTIDIYDYIVLPSGKVSYTDNLVEYIKSFEHFKDFSNEEIGRIIESERFKTLVETARKAGEKHYESFIASKLDNSISADVLINQALVTVTPVPTSTPSPVPTATNTPIPTATSTPAPQQEDNKTYDSEGNQYTIIRYAEEDWKTMYVNTTAGTRCGPSTDFERIAVVHTGDRVTVVGECEGTKWLLIKKDSQEMFIVKSFLSSENPITPTKAPTATPTPTPRPLTISASETKLEFTDTEPKIIYLEVQGDGKFTVNREIKGDQIVNAVYGEWEGERIPVTITPYFNGNTTIEYKLQGTSKYVRIEVTVNVDSFKEVSTTEDALSANGDELIINEDKEYELLVYVKDGQEVKGYSPSCVEVTEKGWLGNTWILSVKPRYNGTGEIEIYLTEDRDTAITIDVTVDIPVEETLATSSKVVPLKDAYIGSAVIFGSYEQDNNLSNGAEEIEWLVLDVQDGKALLISKYGLLTKRYCTILDMSREVINNDYAWDSFYDVAFTSAEQSKISYTGRISDSCGAVPNGKPKGTVGYVFELTMDEVEQYFNDDFLAEEYGDSLLKRVTQATPYAKSLGANRIDDFNSEYCNNSSWALYVEDHTDGVNYITTTGGTGFENEDQIYSVIFGDTVYHATSLARRPVIWVEIE